MTPISSLQRQATRRRRNALARLLILTLPLTLPALAADAPLDATPQTRLDPDLRCLLGSYAFPSGQSVTITGTDGHPRNLSYTLSNGMFGTLQAEDQGRYTAGALSIEFTPCSIGRLRLKQGERIDDGIHLPMIERETSFTSDGIALHGKLVLPPNKRAQSLAVWIEGSNNDPSTDDTAWQYELARRGVAVFVYDKRGTGRSAGNPTSDFHARARDTAAAVREARRLAPGARRVGVIGGSQGGWVAPLVATLTKLDFVIPAFAMAEGPIAQDRELVEQQVRQGGFGETAISEARQLTAITERIVRSNMADGLAELDAFKVTHENAPWLQAIQPRSYTGLFLKFSSADIKVIGPAAAQGLSFTYDPRPTIERIDARQLWLLGGRDQQAPNANTQAILREIQRKRPQLAVVVFPNADHGLVQPITTTDGDAMAYSPQLFDVTTAWIKDRSLPAAGNFITMPAGK